MANENSGVIIGAREMRYKIIKVAMQFGFSHTTIYRV